MTVCWKQKVLSLQKSGNPIKVHRLASLAPNEKGTVEVKMGAGWC